MLAFSVDKGRVISKIYINYVKDLNVTVKIFSRSTKKYLGSKIKPISLCWLYDLKIYFTI